MASINSNYRDESDLETLLDGWVTPSEQQLAGDDRVLLVRLSAIGDVVRALPVVSYLRNNGFEGTLGWLVQPPCDDLLRSFDTIDRVHTINRSGWWKHPLRLRNQVLELGKYQYDWSFDFHGLFKSAFLVNRPSVRRRVGFAAPNCKEFNHLFQDETISELPSEAPRIFKYLSLLRPYTQKYRLDRETIRVSFEPDREFEGSIREAAGEHPVLLHPRTSHDRYGRKKEWGIDNFVTLLRRLAEELDTMPPVRITWGPGERSSAKKLAKRSPEGVRIAPETPDLVHLFYLIEQATLVISGDTAPCHIADLLHTPLVALFGGSDHRVSGPFFTNYRLLTGGESAKSTRDISVNEVREAVLDLLDEV